MFVVCMPEEGTAVDLPVHYFALKVFAEKPSLIFATYIESSAAECFRS